MTVTSDSLQASGEQAHRGLALPTLYQVAGFAVLGAVFVVALAPKLDTDLWWHLETGRWIAQHHAVPSRDFLSFTFTGRSWTDQEWLSELMLYGLYRLAGLWGTIVGFALIILATYAVVYRRLLDRGVHRTLAVFVLVLAFIAATPTWGARPQMITLFFLAVFAWTLDRYQRTSDRRLLAVFPVAMVLWSNLHGGWVLGVVLMAVVFLGMCLNAVSAGALRTDRALPALGAVTVVTVLVTAINPNGLHQILYPLVWILPNSYTNSLTEWVSPDFHMPQMMVFELMLLLFMASLFIARRGLNWVDLLVTLTFTYLAFSEGRNVAVWTVVVAPVVGQSLHNAGQRLSAEEFPSLRYRRRPVEGRIGSILNVVLLVCVVLAYAAEGSHYINAAALAQTERTTYPAGAMRYLDTHRLPPRVFNSYAWGGYLLWKGFPRYRDFIDGRANTLYDTAILSDYLAVSTASPAWRDLLARYRVQVVLVEAGSPLAQALVGDQGWALRYHDSVAVVYERR